LTCDHGAPQMTSLRRLYANTYTDADKQDAINLLLGNFVPRAGTGHLWDLQSDIYLHAAGIAQRCRPFDVLRCAWAANRLQGSWAALMLTPMSWDADASLCLDRRD